MAGAAGLCLAFCQKAPLTTGLAEMSSLLFWGLEFQSPSWFPDVVHFPPPWERWRQSLGVRKECYLGILVVAYRV